MNVVVIGYGSIGARHSRILAELGCCVSVVSTREVPFDNRFSSIGTAVEKFNPEYAVIASATSRHLNDLVALADAGFSGVILVEKPLCHSVEKYVPANYGQVLVAYNLRFHPMLLRLRELLVGERIISVQAYAGQYLPFWRPGRDYRSVYSSHAESGGGVLRDLSHELDLLNWLLGGWRSLTALGGRFSNLEISSDDVYTIMLSMHNCPVASVQMNYLDRVGRRRILVNTATHTFEADITSGKLLIDGEAEAFNVDRDHSYREMHRSILNGKYSDVCSYDEGIDVMRMIMAAELAVKDKQWVYR